MGVMHNRALDRGELGSERGVTLGHRGETTEGAAVWGEGGHGDYKGQALSGTEGEGSSGEAGDGGADT